MQDCNPDFRKDCHRKRWKTVCRRSRFSALPNRPGLNHASAMQKATPLILVLVLAVTATFLSLALERRPVLRGRPGCGSGRRGAETAEIPALRRAGPHRQDGHRRRQGHAAPMAAGGIRHRAGFRRDLRLAGERHALHHLSEQRAAEARFAAPAHRRRLADGGGRPARPRPFPRTHGLQRHETFHRRGTRAAHAAARHRLRRARQCLHLVRRDGLHARPAGPHGRHARSSPSP